MDDKTNAQSPVPLRRSTRVVKKRKFSTSEDSDSHESDESGLGISVRQSKSKKMGKKPNAVERVDKNEAPVPLMGQVVNWPTTVGLVRQFMSRFVRSVEEVACAVCGVRLIPKRKNGFPFKSLLNHVYQHLKKEIFACRHCEYKCSTIVGIHNHVIDTHRLPVAREHWDDATEEYRMEVIEMMDQCFPLDDIPAPKSGIGKLAAPKSRSTSTRSSPIEKHPAYICLVGVYSEFAKDGEIECVKCSKIFTVKRGRLVDLFYHALAHLDLPLYECKYCELSSSDKMRIKNHLRNKHKMLFTDNCVDRSNDFEAPMMEIMMDCYAHRRDSNGKNRGAGKVIQKVTDYSDDDQGSDDDRGLERDSEPEDPTSDQEDYAEEHSSYSMNTENKAQYG